MDQLELGLYHPLLVAVAVSRQIIAVAHDLIDIVKFQERRCPVERLELQGIEQGSSSDGKYEPEDFPQLLPQNPNRLPDHRGRAVAVERFPVVGSRLGVHVVYRPAIRRKLAWSVYLQRSQLI